MSFSVSLNLFFFLKKLVNEQPLDKEKIKAKHLHCHADECMIAEQTCALIYFGIVLS